MIDAICTYNNEQKTYNIFSFQELCDSDIEKFRQHLECPDCSGQAYYRKKSKDGKAACFGSRYHTDQCAESRTSTQREREVLHAVEVNQILAASNEVIFDFFSSELKSSIEIKDRLSESTSARSEKTKSYNRKPSTARQTVLGIEKALNSLMRGSTLAGSETLIEIDLGYKYKAKNLFVSFADAEPFDSRDDARPKMFWGTISHSDADIEWLNPSGCDDVGIPIKKFKDLILKRFNITEKRDLEGAGLILFGKCFWNAPKTRKIIELWNPDRIFISIIED